MPLIDQDRSLRSLTKAVKSLFSNKMKPTPKVTICIITKIAETMQLLNNPDILLPLIMEPWD